MLCRGLPPDWHCIVSTILVVQVEEKKADVVKNYLLLVFTRGNMKPHDLSPGQEVTNSGRPEL